jgi:Patatin-like phospholipase
MPLFHHPYVCGFVSTAHRLLPLVCVGAFLGIVWLDLGAGLNVPALVWHDDPLLQSSAGFSIAALFAYVWLVTYILDARFNPDFIRAAVERPRRGFAFRAVSLILPTPKEDGFDPAAIEYREGGGGLRWYLGATFVPCALLLILPAFFVVDGTNPFIHLTDAYSTPPGRPYIFERWPFVLGVLVTIAGVRAVSGVGIFLRRRMLTTEGRRRFVHRYWLQAVAIVLLLMLAALYGFFWWLVDKGQWQPPPVTAVCMLCGLLVGVIGTIWFHLRRLAVPILIALIVWLTYCNLGEYKLRFPHMEPEYASLLDLEDYEEPALSMKEVEPDDADEDRAAAEREEAERVCRIVASVETQRDPSKSVEQRFQELKADGLTDPAKYDQLLRRYDVMLRVVERDEFNALRSWRDQFRESAPGQRPKLVLLTATGGANRSGLWTAKVLFELHNDPALKDFPKHLRIITGASGGMVGASYYVGSVQKDGQLQEGFRPEDIAQDFLTPIVNSLVFREVPYLAVPTEYYDRDRGEMLDLAMEGDVPRIDPAVKGRLNAVFSRSFADLAPGEREGWRPSLIFSPMIIEDGRRLLISNRHVPFLTVNRGDFLLPNRPTFSDPEGSTRVTSTQRKGRSSKRVKAGDEKHDVYSRPAVEFFRLFPASRDRFRLSTAARMNATFPFVSPAVSIPTKPPRRVVDAGYFDNTGVSVATGWLYQHREWVAKACSGVIVIQVRDFASHRENRHLSLPAQAGGSYLPGLTGPLSAVDHARSASANYRNDDSLRQLSEYFRTYFEANKEATPPQGADQFFTTVVFERYTDVGMNWYLSKSDKQDILDSWDKGTDNMNPASLQKLREWWARH